MVRTSSQTSGIWDRQPVLVKSSDQSYCVLDESKVKIDVGAKWFPPVDALFNVRPSEGRCGIRVQRRFLPSKHAYLLSSRQETYLRHDCDLSVSPSLTRSLTPALFVFLECLSGI